MSDGSGGASLRDEDQGRASLRSAALVIGGLGLVLVLIAHWAYQAFPHSADEYVSLYQARTLLEGRLVNPPLPDPTLQFTHIIATPTGTFGKYPPGWAVVLAPGAALGLPFLVNPLLCVAILALGFHVLRYLFDARTALLGVVLLGASPLFLLNGAALYAHPLAGLSLLGGAACLLDYRREARLRWLLGAGACLGVLGVTRPFDALLTGVAVTPFAAAFLLRGGARAWRHALAGGAVGLGFLLLYLLYNQLTTGDPLTPAHALWDVRDRPVAVGFRTWLPTLRRATEYGLLAYPVALLPLALWVLRGALPRGVIAFVGVLIACFWVGYMAYPVDPPPRLGPRYLFGVHVFSGLLLAAALARALAPRWHHAVIVTLGLGQLLATGVLAGEMHHILWQGSAIYRAADVLERALGKEKALVILAGPSATIPAQDLARNDFAFEQPVVFARQRLRGRDRWERTPLADRRIYYWDGVGGAPVLWTPDPAAPVQQVIATDGDSFVVRPKIAEGWVGTFGASDCAPAPLLGSMWRGAFPPDRISDVQRPSQGHYGPCPGFVHVRQLDAATLPEDLPRRLGIYGHLRSFLTVDTAGALVFTLRGNEEAVLRLGGTPVVESRDGEPHAAIVHLEPGTVPVVLSFYTLWTPPKLALSVRGEAGGAAAWRFTTQVPEAARFRPRLPHGATAAAQRAASGRPGATR